MQRVQETYFDVFPMLTSIVKGFFLIAILLYIAFAFLVIKQVRIMTDTLDLGHETPLKLFSYVHFAFALFVFVFALLTL